MEVWLNKVAIVTGASAGIGQEISRILIEAGLKVVGLSRRVEKMQEFKKNLKNTKGEFFPYECDLTKEEDILKAFEWTKKNLVGVDVLINNAAVLFDGMIIGELFLFKILSE